VKRLVAIDVADWILALLATDLFAADVGLRYN
jgi:hypothetical protein